MTDETRRTLAAVKAVCDGRDPATDMPAIMVTLEGTVAAVLTAVMGGDHRKAAVMLHEGLLEGVERRLAHGAAKRAGG